MIQRFGILLGFLSVLNSAEAQFTVPQTVTTRSQSGQFIVRGTGMAPSSRIVSQDKDLVSLQPVLLAVSCERIKQALYRELSLTRSGQDKIFVNILPPSRSENPVNITSERFRNGWQYQIDLPDPIARATFVQSIIQVLLTEIANRKSEERGAELPPWLVEGLTQQLLASSELQLTLQAPNNIVNGLSVGDRSLDLRRTNRLHQAHESLVAFNPLSFDELSWPYDLASEDRQEAFRSSAQLLVSELKKLPDGRASLGRMLDLMPQYLNWQFAFLQAFRSHFSRPLDVEKWWALQVSHFTGRELSQAWTIEESWDKLNRIIAAPVEVRIGTNDLPLHASVSLQKILRDWPPTRQETAVKQELAQLTVLRGRLDRSLIPLLDDYRDTLKGFLKDHQTKGISLITFRRLGNPARAREVALKQLNVLDARLMALKPSTSSLAENPR